LQARCPTLPHSVFCRLIRKRAIRINGRRVASIHHRISDCDSEIRLPFLAEMGDQPPQLRPNTAKSNAVDLRKLILYQDEYFAILDKPSGLPMHGGSGHPHLHLDSLLWQIHDAARLVHRLDRDSSGALLIAKSRQIASAFSRMFLAKTIEKEYLAVIGVRLPVSETFTTTIAKGSETRWRCRDSQRDRSLLELMPITGRKHQLRRHCAETLGAAIVGDRKYDGADADRLLLHCRSLTFRHPISDEKMTIVAPVPMRFATKNANFFNIDY